MYSLKALLFEHKLNMAELRALLILQQSADDHGYCYLTNAELAEHLQVSPRYFAKLLARLQKLKLVSVSFEGRHGSPREIRVN